ncbi:MULTISPECIES: minor curlin subunit CsgB [Vibrio]|uniref:minor curlin subunit CsgB n=1 Tax=Vibrio TaxID=662 RepID=UPI000570239A|nr:minor curlin subunit CsgB [Vibrio pacinii]
MQNQVIKNIGFVVFSFLMATSAYAGNKNIEYSDEMSTEFGEFNTQGSTIYSELSEMNLSANNYAEVVLENAFDSEVVISQYNQGGGTNKAKVIQSNVNGNKAAISQSGAENLAVIEQSEGQDNYAEIKQAGYGHNSYISQSGSNNLAYLKQCRGLACTNTNGGSDISIVQENNDNFALVVDRGNSNYGITQDGGDSIVIFSNMNRGIYVRQ